MLTEAIILQNLSEVILGIDEKQEVVYSNTSQSSREEVWAVGKPLLESINPGDQQQFTSKLKQARLQTGKDFLLKARVVVSEGKSEWYSFCLKSVAAQDDNQIVIAVVRRLDGLLTEEKSQLESEAAFRDAEEFGHTGSWWVDLETKENHWSPGNYSLWNLDPADGPPPLKKLLGMLDPTDAVAIQEAMQLVQDTQKDQSLTFRIFNDDQSVRYILTRMTPWYVNGEFKEVKGFNIEITDIIEIQQELEKKIKELSIQNEKLEKFVFINSHEVRRPVTNIMGLLELAKLNKVSSNQLVTMLGQEAALIDTWIKRINYELSSGKADPLSKLTQDSPANIAFKSAGE